MSSQVRKKVSKVRFEDIIMVARKISTSHRPRVAVAGAHDPIVLDVLCDAAGQGFASPLLYGDESKIRRIAARSRLSLKGCDIVDVPDSTRSARMAAEAASSGEADVLMKGNVTTATLMKAALDGDIGIKTDRLMSHVAVFESENFKRIMFMSDGGIVIEPDLTQKVEIVKNAVRVATALGVKTPRVAMLSCIEVVNTKMKSAVEAAIISKMAERGQIPGAIVDGPFALDNAVSIEAAKQKGVKGPVAGLADILIVGHADVGNVFYKTLTYFCGKQTKTAGVIVGGIVPMVAVSRADTYEARLNSIAVACVLSQRPA
ncbi:MAG: bifunctional enoyl-CoA hydratase/phosphate acetyltransferase [Candidatus Eisenbacteria bacterium]